MRTLFLATATDVEVWNVHDQKHVFCIYRKREEEAKLFKFVDGAPASPTVPAETSMYSDFAPLAGIVSTSEERMFKLLSLRESRFLHILRFCSTIHDFKSSASHIVFSLSEGMLKVYNAANFEQLYSLLSHNDFREGGRKYLGDLGPEFDISSTLVAFVKTEIYEMESTEERALQYVEESSIGSYAFTKEATKGIISFGHNSKKRSLSIS